MKKLRFVARFFLLLIAMTSFVACGPEKPKPDDKPTEAIELKIEKHVGGNLVVSVTASDKDMFVVVVAAEKKYLDSLGSDERIFQDDMAFYHQQADAIGVQFKDILDQLGGYGYDNELIDINVGDAPSGAECYVYAYGITYDDQPELLTKVYKQQFVAK